MNRVRYKLHKIISSYEARSGKTPLLSPDFPSVDKLIDPEVTDEEVFNWITTAFGGRWGREHLVHQVTGRSRDQWLLDWERAKEEIHEDADADNVEYVVVVQTDNKSIKIAYRNHASLVRGLTEQTREGWVVTHVYRRPLKTYASEPSPI